MKKSIRIAYLVIAYMDPEQLRRLSARLVQTSDVYIHINASVDIQPFEESLQTVSGDGRITFAKDRYRIVWGGYSILEATFSMLRQALQNADYGRIVLLTGLDYPIRTDQEIQDFFETHADVEYIHADVVSGQQYDHLNYYDCRDSRLFHKLFGILRDVLKSCGRIGKKDFLIQDGRKYLLYGIAPKWALSGDCARYLLDFHDKNRRFNRYFQLMHAPDDFYVATVLFNSRFQEHIESQKDIFKIVWLPEDKGAKILSEEDLGELLQGEELYAKKFQSGSSEKLLDQLNERKKGRGEETGL